MARNSSSSSIPYIIIGIIATISIGAVTWHIVQQQQQQQQQKETPQDPTTSKKKQKSLDLGKSKKAGETVATTEEDEGGRSTVDKIRRQIEDLDKKGKVLYKEKKFIDAAQTFSEALELIVDDHQDDGSDVLQRQKITLLNNRSAMYEKAQCFDLALDDCEAILQADITHGKARPRKLRIFESQERWKEALQEVCSMQLMFMQDNKMNIRMGLPLPPPPVPSQKLEEILEKIMPAQLEQYAANMKRNTMPGPYTILQLLRSYKNYNEWTQQAKADGPSAKLTKTLDAAKTDKDKLVLFYKRGRRYAWERDYEKATLDFEAALALAKANPGILDDCKEVSYTDVLEWTGMVRHWHFRLEPALECLGEAIQLIPDRASLLVKQAGVQLDSNKIDDALKLFDQALILDPESTDALLHRSNLRIMQGQSDQAKSDLERCLRIDPDNLMANLRLIAVLVSLQEMDAAQRRMDAIDSNSAECEVHSYRGEMCFAQGDMASAVQQFEQAIAAEPTNPTPYVNAAMAILNTPPTSPGEMPDTTKACALLEKSIEVDPQVSAAYVHLGQLKLGMASDVETAREVIELYDRGLQHCRTADEIKELCGMRILAQSQVDAAFSLNMETFNPK